MKDRRPENKMEDFEYFRDLKILPQSYFVLRVDGRGFHRVTHLLKFATPFDRRFRNLLIAATHDFMRHNDFQVIAAYIQSDEISCVVDKTATAFHRRVEKIASVGASLISVAFNKHLLATEFPSIETPIVFDARIAVFPTRALILRYLQHRQRDCVTNALSSYCYWKLRETGLTGTQAARKLTGMKKQKRHDFLHTLGINFNDIPAWEKRGSILYFAKQPFTGINQKTKKSITYTRNRIVDEDCPDLLRGEAATIATHFSKIMGLGS